MGAVPLPANDVSELLGWIGANSAFAFSRAAGVTIAQDPRAKDRYLVEFEETREDLAGGLAAAVTLDGYYITASHVLKDNGAVLLLRGERGVLFQERARLVWRSPQDGDLALIKGEPRETCFPIAQRPARVGEVVIAGGAIGGESAGVVLSVNDRDLMHSAPLRRGDSGGPLINAAGELVGVNRAIHYDILRGRRNEAVHIDVRAILEAIRKDRRKAKS